MYKYRLPVTLTQTGIPEFGNLCRLLVVEGSSAWRGGGEKANIDHEVRVKFWGHFIELQL